MSSSLIKTKTMTRLFILVLMLSIGFTTGKAQDVSAAFKAGLNLSRFSGPFEMDSNNQELEKFSFATGFHLAGGVNVRFTDLFGMRAELMYSQKGVEYTFDGESYWIFYPSDGSEIYSTGTRSRVLSITNTYFDLPVVGYIRYGRIELSAGASIGALISSRGQGEVIYSGQTVGGEAIDPFTIALDFNYFKDDVQRTDVGESENRLIQGKSVDIPKNVGANYAVFGPEEKLFNTLDIGLVAGAAFFLNDGLYVGIRLNYGLVDVTNEEKDISYVNLDENRDFIPRNDFDRNVSLQISVGFSTH